MEAGAPGAGFPLSRASLRRPAIVSSPSAPGPFAPRRPTFAPLTLLSSLKDQYQPLLLLELLVALKIPCLARAVGTALAGKEILLSLLSALERKPRPSFRATTEPSSPQTTARAGGPFSFPSFLFAVRVLLGAWRLQPCRPSTPPPLRRIVANGAPFAYGLGRAEEGRTAVPRSVGSVWLGGGEAAFPSVMATFVVPFLPSSSSRSGERGRAGGRRKRARERERGSRSRTGIRRALSCCC